jgi:hypothetical protein
MRWIKYSLLIAMAMVLFGGCAKKVVDPWKEIDNEVKRPKLSTYELETISEKIYMNETGGNPDYIMYWSKNEIFPSLGIGHFIWYPTGVPKRFDETFPAMIQYYIDNKVEIPAWLKAQKDRGAPWPNRATFEKARNDKEFIALKYLLLNTKGLQTQFFFDRLYDSIPEIAKHVAPQDRQRVINNYKTLSETPGGWYPLIDYINFKGKGIKGTEKYNGQGWGLLQVLQEMRPVPKGPLALQEFSRAASVVLQRRVKNSPPQNHEERFLRGWMTRTKSYATPLY